jgi:Ni,Fe-hydrogenase I cytochrome b subunit
MTFWQFLDGIMRHPPAILGFVVVAAIVAHVFKIALEFLTKHKQPRVVIVTLEIILVIVLSYITLHLYLSQDVVPPESAGSNPFAVLLVLVCFTLLSMVIYLFLHLISSEAGNS